MGAAEAADRATVRWQRQLLPVMITVLLGLMIFFVAESCVQFRILTRYVSEEQVLDVGAVLSSTTPGGEGARRSVRDLVSLGLARVGL